jgi:hypothetical protein
MSEVILSNDVSRLGLRRLHVVSPKQVKRENWLARLPETAIDTLSVMDFMESELGVWHLHLWWEAREILPLNIEGMICECVMWWIGKAYGEGDRPATLREAADLAASLWWMKKGVWPGRCLVQKLPKAATADTEVGWGLFAEGSGPRVKLEEAAWVPKGFVVVL